MPRAIKTPEERRVSRWMSQNIESDSRQHNKHDIQHGIWTGPTVFGPPSRGLYLEAQVVIRSWPSPAPDPHREHKTATQQQLLSSCQKDRCVYRYAIKLDHRAGASHIRATEHSDRQALSVAGCFISSSELPTHSLEDATCNGVNLHF